MTLILPHTPFMDAVRELVTRLDRTIPASTTRTVTAYVVGGTAVHIYTSHRVSNDFDAKFVPRLLINQNIVVRYLDQGHEEYLRLDRNYFEELGLMHPDWEADSLEAVQIERITLRVISPIDLAVSKVARFADNDRGDIEQLAGAGLLDAEKFRVRCDEALGYYVGDPTMIDYNIRDAMGLIAANTRPSHKT